MCGLTEIERQEFNNKSCKDIKIELMMEGVSLIKSGYAGVNKLGTIVDRRDFPNAIPCQENSLFGTPKPKKL